MLSIGRIGAGDGYKYLTSQVASQDAPRRGERLLGYYERTGHPAGIWVGEQAARFDLSGLVTEEPMEHLFGHCSHPTETLRTSTGATVLDASCAEVHVPLGRRMAQYRSIEERIRARVEAMNQSPSADDREALASAETLKGQSQAVTGFDLTFSAPKSVSILWALCGDDVRDELRAAHEAAWREALWWIETEVAATRLGRAGVAQVDVHGVCAAAFEHWYDRAGDPQLHTHMAVSAIVETLDGRWRRLDSRALYRSAAAAGERYTAKLMAEATDRLGLQWRHRRSGRSDTLLPEIDGVDDEMIAEFSPRSAQVKANLARLVGEYKDRHGYSPDRATTARLAQEAVMEGRPHSQQRCWEDERIRWLERAGRSLEVDPVCVADVLRSRTVEAAADQDKETRPLLEEAVTDVLLRLEEHGATWSARDVQRQSTAVLRELGVVDVDLAAKVAADVISDARSIPIRASEPGGDVPTLLCRRSGESVFDRAGEERFTSVAVIEAEARLAALGGAFVTAHYADWTDGALGRGCEELGEQIRQARPRLYEHPQGTARKVVEAYLMELIEGHAAMTIERARRRCGHATVTVDLDDLSEDQATAVIRLAEWSRPLDTLIGPAGSGKTTVLDTLVKAWRKMDRDVVVLGPTAIAAGVIGEAVGEQGDTLDAALARWERGDDLPSEGALVLIDEASMATSPKLSRVIEIALINGAVVRCVGDPRQLKAVGAGGGLSILADAVQGPELGNLHRFREKWEGPATLRLRSGDPEVVVDYERHGRVTEGLEPDAVETLYRTWKASPSGPHGTLMIASDNEAARTLNERSRAERVATREVEDGGLQLVDGSICGVGDVIVTRRNDRTIPTGRKAGGGGYVRNRDRWIVTERSDDGNLTVRHVKTGAQAVLPSAYVAEHVELSYAVTGHGAQGLTVEVAHALIRPTDTRQYAYVAMTRGRELNHAHVVTGQLRDEPTGYEPEMTARSVLAQVLANDEPVSARDHARVAVDRADDLFEIVSRYRYAQTEEMLTRVRPALAGLGAPDLLDHPDGWILRQALEVAEDRGFDSAELVRSCRANGAVEELATQVQRACWSGTTPAGERVRPQPLVGGLVPAPGSYVDADVASYLKRLGGTIVERRTATEKQILQGVVPSWALRWAPPPDDPELTSHWAADVAQVAVWRGAQRIVDDEDLLGPSLPPGHRDAPARATAVVAASQITNTPELTDRSREEDLKPKQNPRPDYGLV